MINKVNLVVKLLCFLIIMLVSCNQGNNTITYRWFENEEHHIGLLIPELAQGQNLENGLHGDLEQVAWIILDFDSAVHIAIINDNSIESSNSQAIDQIKYRLKSRYSDNGLEIIDVSQEKINDKEVPVVTYRLVSTYQESPLLRKDYIFIRNEEIIIVTTASFLESYLQWEPVFNHMLTSFEKDTK